MDEAIKVSQIHESITFEINTKSTQHNPELSTKGTQTSVIIKKDNCKNTAATVVKKKSIGIQTSLPCEHEIKDTVADVMKDLVTTVEGQFSVKGIPKFFTAKKLSVVFKLSVSKYLIRFFMFAKTDFSKRFFCQ